MFKKFSMRAALVASFCAGLAIVGHAAGLYSTLPGLGQGSYCASYVTGANGQVCGQTVPAGPSVFTGNEYLPMDLGPLGSNDQTGGPKTVAVSILQLGSGGPMVDLTTVGTANTIPNATPYYYIDGPQASAFTVTMPAQALEGQVQKIVCEQSTTGVLTVAANTGQSVKVNPNTACVAGVSYLFRYQASSATWFRG